MLRKFLTGAVVAVGPDNTVVRTLLSRAVRQHGGTLDFSDCTIGVHKDDRCIRIAARHFPFAPELAEKFDFFFRQVEAPGGLLDASSTRVHRYLGSGLEFELTSLPEEQQAIDSYFAVVRPGLGDLAFDIGAYCGVTTFHLSKLVGAQGSVVAFEPDSANHAALVHNIERHQLKNVIPVQAAIAQQSGRLKFNSEGWMGSVLNTPSSRAGLGAVTEVECFSLEDAGSRWGVPSYIKIDIEGEEIAVIARAQPFISRSDIRFAVDTDHVRGLSVTAGRVEGLFRSCGYQTGTIRTNYFLTTWARRA